MARGVLDNYPRTKAIAVVGRKWIRKLGDPIKGHADKRRLIDRYPCLGSRNQLIQEFPEELTRLHEEYTSSVSNKVMAISLELSMLMYALCRQIEPKSILDLGSGYSSVVFRHYAKNCSDATAVVSVDDSAGWLIRTKEYLTAKGLPTEGMMDWPSFTRAGLPQFDMVFYDLGHVRELRTEAFGQVLGFVKPGGVIILDDMNFLGYKRHVKRVLRGKPFVSLSAESLSQDTLGRYPYLLVANENPP